MYIKQIPNDLLLIIPLKITALEIPILNHRLSVLK